MTYSNGSNDLLDAVQGPCQRHGIQCTDVTECHDAREAAASGPHIGKRIMFKSK